MLLHFLAAAVSKHRSERGIPCSRRGSRSALGPRSTLRATAADAHCCRHPRECVQLAVADGAEFAG